MKRRGNRIVTTAVEHHSVLAICKALENEGFEVITAVSYTHLDVYKRQAQSPLTRFCLLLAQKEAPAG